VQAALLGGGNAPIFEHLIHRAARQLLSAAQRTGEQLFAARNRRVVYR
jgi:hypothetical protein